MKIIQGAKEYMILTSKEFLLEQLLVLERAGRTSYQSEKHEITVDSATGFVKRMIRSGHESVIEHSVLSVKFLNCSRGLTHELVRHRHSAFTQESTRYVGYDKNDFQVVLPNHVDANELIDLGEDEFTTPTEMVETLEQFYSAMKKAGWKSQDARQFLPIGIKSEIVISANFREWRHIFYLRTAKDAHWEIRSAMCKLLDELQGMIPAIFDDFEKAGEDKNGIPFYKKIKI